MTRKIDNSGKSAAFRDPFTVSSLKSRKTGNRAKLATRFFQDFYEVWEEQGEAAMRRFAFHDPAGFVSVAARLMPQKIEVATPTDGISDERLADLLDYAERMAGLKAEAARVIDGSAVAVSHKLADENGAALDPACEGGGGPLRRMGVGGENTPNTIAAAETVSADTPERHNRLEQARLPHPVGRPVPLHERAAEARNRAKLDPVEPVDPNSLF